MSEIISEETATITLARENWIEIVNYLQELPAGRVDIFAGWIIDELNK